ERQINVVVKLRADATPTKVKLTPAGNKRASILVVDDLPANIEFVRSTLEPSGYRVFAAAGVQEAIGIAENEKLDLVLCDLHMRPLGGYALLEIAKGKPALKEIQIVIISSTASGEIDHRD